LYSVIGIETVVYLYFLFELKTSNTLSY